MAGCERCGDCCDPVWFALGPADVRQSAGLATGADADNLTFVVAHWQATGERHDGLYAYACDRFDQGTRLCTAHDQRPPVCRGYPYYDRPHVPVVLPSRCSFPNVAPTPTVDLTVTVESG